MGEMPDWYKTIAAARYLKVKPWELIEQPMQWKLWAFKAMTAEAGAQESINNRGK